MKPGNDKHGAKVDETMKSETESIERTGREGHVEEEREQQGGPGDSALGETISGSGSSADTYPYRDHGEEGGASHPQPKADD
jgi:hypothetical protein